MPGDKRTKEEQNKVIEQVYQMLLLGMRPPQIFENVKKIAEKDGKELKCQATFYNDLAKARELLEKDAAPRRKMELGRNKARLEWLFMKLAAIQDYKGALAVTREINELLGLHAPKQLEFREIKPITYVPAKKKGKI